MKKVIVAVALLASVLAGAAPASAQQGQPLPCVKTKRSAPCYAYHTCLVQRGLSTHTTSTVVASARGRGTLTVWHIDSSGAWHKLSSKYSRQDHDIFVGLTTQLDDAPVTTVRLAFYGSMRLTRTWAACNSYY